jgi:hypothetical protein
MTERILEHDSVPEVQELACENVEWLAALWELTEVRESRTANPKLLTVLRCTSRLPFHPAVDAVVRARRLHSRDKLIKLVVRDTYGESTSPPDLRAALTRLRAERDDLLGRVPSRLIDDARRRAVRRVEVMAGRLDPAADMAALTGEYVPLRVALAPSVFLGTACSCAGPTTGWRTSTSGSRSKATSRRSASTGLGCSAGPGTTRSTCS